MSGTTIQLSDIDFLIIGAAKCATTWLQRQLQADPGVYMPGPELHYFSREHERGPDWYLAQFEPERPDLTIGEKSNSYLDDPAYAERVHAALPHIQLMAQLRNPVERAYSDYCMLFRRGEVDANIQDHLDPRRAAEGRFLSGGDYARQLQPFIDLYGRDRLLILLFDEVESQPQAQVTKARAHLGLPDLGAAPAVVQSKVKDKRTKLLPVGLRKALAPLKPLVKPLRGSALFENARSLLAREPKYPGFSQDLRARLVDHYADSIDRLEALIGRPLSWR